MRIHHAAVVGFVLCLGSCLHAATYHVSITGDDNAAGTVQAPWRTIQRAVDALKPGDTVLIGAGIYREAITIKTSGTAEAPITLAAIPGARVVVTGADLLKDWKKAGDAGANLYVRDWAYLFPIGRRDGKPILTHPNDAEHELIGRAEQVIHEGRLLRQVLKREQLAPGTFFVDIDARKLYVCLTGGDPNQDELEASTRSNWLVARPGVSHVRVRGLMFRYAANHAQRGAFTLGIAYGSASPGVSRGWIVEDCVFSLANASGASFSGEGHVFRRCVFQDNGQLGFGAGNCHDTLVEDCGFYRNNTKGYSTGWEAGGLKVVLSRGFVFDRCRAVGNHGTGIWYDIGNEKAEVKNCFIADNDEAGIFYEISYGLHAHDNLIVNNSNHREKPGHAWGMAGLTLSSSQDCIVENNTLIGNRDGIALREQNRETPRIDAPRGQSVRIFNKNHVIRNNLAAYSQAYNVAFWMDTNFFDTKAPEAGKLIFENPATLSIRLENNLLWPLPGRPNYLYGATWKPKSKRFVTPEEFTKGSRIADSSRIADPLFTDVTAGDYRLRAESPVNSMGVGVRSAR